MNIIYKPLDISYLDQVTDLESEGYAEDEAASRQTMEYRLTHASQFYLGVFNRQEGQDSLELIGYVCSTCTHGTQLTHDTMFKHVDDGETLCVHSVLIKPTYKRKGLGIDAMKYYVDYVFRHFDAIQRISLISRPFLIQFYEKSGFKLIGESSVVHGKELWFDMVIERKEWQSCNP